MLIVLNKKKYFIFPSKISLAAGIKRKKKIGGRKMTGHCPKIQQQQFSQANQLSPVHLHKTTYYEAFRSRTAF